MENPIIRPKQRQVYLYEEISKVLYLRDSPSLIITGVGVIQTSHLTEEELLSIPGFKDTKWMYVRETIEWIPIFKSEEFEDNMKLILSCVDYEPWVNYPFNEGGTPNWVTPKGFPRAQNN